VILFKADAIQEKIGYPDYIKNDSALDFDYQDVSAEIMLYFISCFCIRHLTVTVVFLRADRQTDRQRGR